MISSDMSLPLREERAFYNAASDPHVFPTDTFVGRTHELAALQQGIAEAPGRLVTLVGPAGVGKTRLALEAMRTAEERYPGGAVVVRLAAIERPGDIVPEIARAMGIVDQSEKLDAIVREELNAAPSVVLLDCYEHLTPAANPIVADLRASCPELRIVLTSRRSSGLPDDWRLELHPLAVTRPDATTSGPLSEAVQLFVARAQKANDRFRLRPEDVPVIEELCARYDGLPLAIELMASWVTVLAPRELLDWKPDQLAFRTPAADPRHQSLMDAIAWSFGLLTQDEQALLAAPLGFLRRVQPRSGGKDGSRTQELARAIPMRMGIRLCGSFDIDGLGNPTDQPQDPSIARALSALADRSGARAGRADRSPSGLSSWRDRWRAPLRHAGGDPRVRIAAIGADRRAAGGPACACRRDDCVCRSILRGLWNISVPRMGTRADRCGPPELARGACLGDHAGRCRRRDRHTPLGRALDLLANARPVDRRARVYRRLDLSPGTSALVPLHQYAGSRFPHMDPGRRRALPRDDQGGIGGFGGHEFL